MITLLLLLLLLLTIAFDERLDCVSGRTSVSTLSYPLRCMNDAILRDSKCQLARLHSTKYSRNFNKDLILEAKARAEDSGFVVEDMWTKVPTPNLTK